MRALVRGVKPLRRVLSDSVCGCSSVVEHHVANVRVVSSNLITRSSPFAGSWIDLPAVGAEAFGA